MPTTIEALTIAVLFFVPGFLTEWALDRFSVGPKRSDLQRILSALTLSGVIWLIPGPFLYLYWQDGHSFWTVYVACAVFVLVVPFVLAFILTKFGPPARLGLQEWLKRPVLDSRPTAWDLAFSSEAARYVIVHTSDGDTFGGVFGTESCAGSHGDHDLYIQQRWELDADEGFVAADRDSGGMYFPADSILYVEFRISSEEGET